MGDRSVDERKLKQVEIAAKQINLCSWQNQLSSKNLMFDFRFI